MSLRIVALTTDPSLSVAMTMIPESDVFETNNVFTAARLSQESDVLVVGLGDTSSGQAAVTELRQQGVRIPFVIVGDRAPANDEWIDAPLLFPPFTVDDIMKAANEAIASSRPSYAVDRQIAAAATYTPVHEPIIPPRVEPELPPLPVEPAPVVLESSTDVAEVPEVSTEDLMVTPVYEEPAAPERATPAVQLNNLEPDEIAEADDAYVSQASVTVAQPSDVAPVRPSGPIVPEVVHPQPKRRFRREREKARPKAPVRTRAGSSGIEDRIGAGLRAVADLNGLVDELPVLASPGALADVLLGEVVERFRPQMAGILLRTGDVLTTSAAIGFTHQEMSMKVSLAQPLIEQLLTNNETLFIAPVDLARGLLSGIPGTRTEALLAAPVTHEDELVAVILVGGDRFPENALALLDEVAREAAPGFALANGIDRLRYR